MKITKYGHSALHITYKEKGFMIDPGGFSDLPEKYPHIDVVLITHEHGDHLDIEEIKRVREQYPNVSIITNSSIVKILAAEGIDANLVQDGDVEYVGDVAVRGVGSEHAVICCGYGLVENVGYMIDKAFYYPGDSFTAPPERVDVLGAPLAGPWMAVKEVIALVNEVQPKKVIPMHDAVLSECGKDVHYRIFENNINEGIEFVKMEDGKESSL